MASKATTEKSAGTMSAEQAREEAAYTLGVQAYLWGVPIVEYGKTGVGGLKARAVALNSFRKYPTLKTAKDRFVVTPNNVTIDGYGVCDLKGRTGGHLRAQTHGGPLVHRPARRLLRRDLPQHRWHKGPAARRLHRHWPGFQRRDSRRDDTTALADAMVLRQRCACS